MAKLNVMSIVSLCLLLPSSLAMPFELPFFHERNLHHWNETSSMPAFPTGTGTAFYPSATAPVPTGSYAKRHANVQERRYYDFPTAFSASFPTSLLSATGTGHAFSTGYLPHGKHEAYAFEGPRKEKRDYYWPYYPMPSKHAPTFTAPGSFPTAAPTFPTATAPSGSFRP